MGPYKGDYPTGFAPPLVFMFSAFDSNDPSASVTVTGLAVGDIKVFKDGGLTERASTAGFAVDTDVDAITGVHFVSIDIDNNDDAGFFAAGSEYDVVVASITIDGATVNFHAGSFSIERAGGALAEIKTIAAQLAGITLLNEWLGAIAGKQNADATALTEIKATGAGSGTYDPNTDSTEAIRDRGDAAWVTATGFSTHSAADAGAAAHDVSIENHDNQGTAGWATALGVYGGPDGPGIYIDSGAANTNTVVGTDGTEINPVSTFAAARTLADALGLKVYYLEGNSDITLAATHEDWEFIGIGSVADNVVNLGSQDVDRSLFRNLTIEGTQGGTGRITARDCALQDPGAGTTTFHIFAERCGIVDDILVDTSADNVFDQCYSLAASGVAPIITATGAAGSIVLSHWGGKLELKSLSASHNIELDGNGQLTFNADCNVNANLDIHGVWNVIDNTAGMSDLATMPGLVNMSKINAEADTALTDYDGPTNAEMEARTIVSANYALASVLGALNDAAAAGDVTTADTLMQYLKQVINLLAGGPGIATNPSAAVPANAVNVFEILNSLSDRLPTALASGNIKSDMLAISGDTTAADSLEALMDGIVVAQVNDGSATTTAFAADGFTEATDDHFKGRLITFISGALSGQQTDITGYNAAGGAQGSQEFTVTALTEAPAEDVFFVIH